MISNGKSAPIALHQLYEVEVNNEIVISLHGVDLDGDEVNQTKIKWYSSFISLSSHLFTCLFIDNCHNHKSPHYGYNSSINICI